MLKAFLGFLVSVVVLLSSAYVPPAYAASAAIIMTHIQAGGAGAATQEFVGIYNNSNQEVDITNWCLTNKANIVFACFSTDPNQIRFLPAHAYAVAASSSLVTALPSVRFTTVYNPLSQSSGSMIGGGDTISLVDQTGLLIDQHAWTTSLAGGTQLARHKQPSLPVVYDDSDLTADWSVASPSYIPEDETVLETTIIDLCVNIDGDQSTVPEGLVRDVDGVCQERVITQLDLSELLPNAIGSDEGNEFIELFNPNAHPVDLAAYRLWVGADFDIAYAFPEGSIIGAQSHLSFSNAAIAFSLLNSSSRVRLATDDGAIVSETPAYLDPKDGASWALIGGMWQYTKLPTPGMENALSGLEVLVEIVSAPTPCAANQYRNPETGRCRLLSTSGSTPTPCKDGQYRSEETNRCRTIAADAKTVTACDEDQERNPETGRCRKITSTATPAACKEGQARNPDTNRCRTVTKMPSADYAVLGAKTEDSGAWYAWIAVGGILLLAIGYAIWEWHSEIGKFTASLLGRVPLFARLRK